MNKKEILIRALKTFVQAFVPVVLGSLRVCDTADIPQMKMIFYSALISASAAGLSAVWNTIIYKIERE